MTNTRKTTMILALSANFVLSAFLCFAIWSGNQSAAKKNDNSVGQDNEASKLVAARATSQRYRATTREEAIKQARQSAIRRDPTSLGLSSASTYLAPQDAKYANKISVPSQAVVHKVPAPPAILPIAELPPPPSPTVSVQSTPNRSTKQRGLAGLKLTGVIGNKAIISMRREGSRRTDRPEILCLAPGEETRTIDNTLVSIESVEKDRVTLCIGGKRMTRILPDIH